MRNTSLRGKKKNNNNSFVYAPGETTYSERNNVQVKFKIRNNDKDDNNSMNNCNAFIRHLA